MALGRSTRRAAAERIEKISFTGINLILQMGMMHPAKDATRGRSL